MIKKSEVQSLWAEKINKIFIKEEQSEIEKMIDILSISVHSSENDDLSRMYKLLDLDLFIQFMDLYSGRELKIPDIDDFRDMLLTSICYYYKELKGDSWESIKERFNLKDFSTIKFGKSVMKLNRNIQKRLKELYKEQNNE